MAGYIKGTTAEQEMKTIRAAVHRAITAIQAAPDPDAGYQAAAELAAIGKAISSDAADLRGWMAASLNENFGMSLADIAGSLGISKARAAQLVTQGKRKGNLMTDPGTDPEPATVALAIIVDNGNVLVEHRVDRIPPYTFPGGELLTGESPAAAVARRVPEETGTAITVSHIIGRRIHPKTGRAIVYLAAAASSTDVHVGDPEDLDEVKWVSIAETREIMADMFGPVREYLDGL